MLRNKLRETKINNKRESERDRGTEREIERKRDR